MTEIEIKVPMYLLGKVTQGNKPTFLKFEVWVRVEGTDSDITAQMCEQQIKDLQETFLEEVDKANESELEAMRTDEDRAERFKEDYAETLLGEFKIAIEGGD